MVDDRSEFTSGPTTWDLMRYHLIVGGVTMGFFLLLLMVVSVGVAIGVESIMGIIVGFLLGIMIFIPVLILIIPVLLLRAYLIKAIHYNNNKVRLGRNGIQTILVRNRFYPAIKNTIPYDRIERIEEGTDGYIQHIREKTPKWYLVMSMLHRIPHAGLYIPLTSPKNLLVIYMDRPIEITNNNMKNMIYRGLKIEKHPVTEVIIDVESSRHEEFIDSLDWYLRNGQVRKY